MTSRFQYKKYRQFKENGDITIYCLPENGLTLEDVIEPDLNKQKEYHKLLKAILNSEGEKQAELLEYASDILQMENASKRVRFSTKIC